MLVQHALVSVFSAGLCFIRSVHAARPAADKPNIIVILADDLGYADLGCQGSGDVKTPQIDSIAANGVRCTAGYVTAPQCCPSRAGLITGRYQNRFGFEVNFPMELYLQGRVGLPPGEATIADRLKAAGFATGIVGKWHLGDTEPMRPCQRGFSEAFWHPNGGVLFPDAKTGFIHNLWRRQPARAVGGILDRRLWLRGRAVHRAASARAVLSLSLLRRAALAHGGQAGAPGAVRPRARPAPAHLPGDDGLARRERRRVLVKLRETKLEENTLVFFLSDNGGQTGPTARARSDAPFQYGVNASRNSPCRGEKGDLLEGGIRVPFLVQWKGRIPAGKVYDRPVISLDIASTALGAAGVKPVPTGNWTERTSCRTSPAISRAIRTTCSAGGSVSLRTSRSTIAGPCDGATGSS